MSSFTSAQKSMGRAHRERSQPAKRKHLGVLEKKKDWIKRARAYQKKAKNLKKLRKNARERNRDEFNFGMINSKVGLDGVHRKGEELDEEQTETQRLIHDIEDIKYVNHKLAVERKKIEKLKSGLHLTDIDNRPNKRTIFLDSAKEVRNYKFAKPNNPTKFRVDLSREEAMEIEKLRQSQYAELKQRIERENELNVVRQKLETKKELALSKRRTVPKLIQKGDKTRPAIFKWKYERKK